MDPSVYESMQRQDRQHWWFVARRRILRAQLATLGLPAEARILEAGCGAGGNLAMLGEFGSVSAMEMEPTMRAIAAERSGISVVPGTLPENVPFASGSFDLVAALDVIEHVEQDREAIATLASLLRPDGALVLTVPAYRWMWSDHDRRHHHQRRYLRQDIATMIEGTGLRVERLSYFNTLLFPLAAVSRVTERLLNRKAAEDEGLPGGTMNAVLREIFALECKLLRFVDFPFGLSILAIARRA